VQEKIEIEGDHLAVGKEKPKRQSLCKRIKIFLGACVLLRSIV